MKLSRYIIVPLCALAIGACKQRTESSGADSTASAIQKEEADTIKRSDTAALDLPGEKPVPLAQLIVPGVSIGQTALNESSENVHKKLGGPDDGDAAMGKSVSIWYADHNKKGYVTQMYFSRDMGNDETARVKQIRVTSPSFKVSNKLYTGVLLKTAEAIYKLKKAGTFSMNGSNRNIFDDEAAGIAFDTDRSGTITGITIHETGKGVLNSYMAFFPGVKPVK